MAVTDVWADWSTTASSNTPAGSAVPEIDDELRNMKAQMVLNTATVTGDQTIAGTKTFSTLPILEAANPATVNETVRASVLQTQACITATAGGTGDALTVALTPTLAAYAAGQMFTIKLVADNTTAATIAFEALGAKDIKKRGPDGSLIALVAGDLKNGQEILIIYDGTQFVLHNPIVPAASQAEQEASTETGKFVAPATQKYHPSAAKAWVHVTGADNPARAGYYNVTSITDSNQGLFIVVFTVAFSTTDYAMVAAGEYKSTVYNTSAGYRADSPPAVGACGVATIQHNVGVVDIDHWSAVFYGDQ